MAVPKRRQSTARGRKRRTHYKLKSPNLPRGDKVRAPGAQSGKFFCSNCKQQKPPHAVCPNCGHYRGRAAVTKEG